jgi:hypothetical protein
MDYTTTADVFIYGDVQAPSVNQTAVMNSFVTAVSRKVDKICTMNFSSATFTNKLTPVRVTNDGVLTLYANSPTMSSVTSINLRAGNNTTLLPVNIADMEINAYDYGTKISIYGMDYYSFRELRTLRAYMSYTGGWTALNQVPYDFQFAVKRFTWFMYQQRAAPMQTTAVPELGMITLPAAVPPDVMDVLKRYAWWWS